MLKKAIIGTVGVTLLLGFLFGRDAFSYVSTTAGWVRDSVRDSIPLQLEIDRARTEVAGLADGIRKNMTVIAQEEVAVDQLEKRIAQSEERVFKSQAAVLRLKDDLSSGKSQFQYAGRSYSAQRVKVDLANRFEQLKTDDATLESMRDILTARQKTLKAAQDKLAGMIAAKRTLEVQVENCQARLKMLEAAQTTSEFSFDDSQLGRAKEMISDLQTRLDVASKLLDAQGDMVGEIPLDEPVRENIVEEVTQYFEQPRQVAVQ